MARRGLLQPMSCFTISISLLLLLIFALSSYQAAASSASSSGEPVATISETRRSMISWPWDHWRLPKDWLKKSAKEIIALLEKLRKGIMDEMLKIVGLPPTGDIFNFLMKAVKWLYPKLAFFISDPKARIDTVMDWIVDSILNPFRTLKDGMLSFRRLFRYLHRLKKGSNADFGRDNPVYKCYKEFFPGCVARSGTLIPDIVAYYFECSFQFYERCQLRYWWENGKWKVPRINGGDPCKVIPWKKCEDFPPI